MSDSATSNNEQNTSSVNNERVEELVKYFSQNNDPDVVNSCNKYLASLLVGANPSSTNKEKIQGTLCSILNVKEQLMEDNTIQQLVTIDLQSVGNAIAIQPAVYTGKEKLESGMSVVVFVSDNGVVTIGEIIPNKDHSSYLGSEDISDDESEHDEISSFIDGADRIDSDNEESDDDEAKSEVEEQSEDEEEMEEHILEPVLPDSVQFDSSEMNDVVSSINWDNITLEDLLVIDSYLLSLCENHDGLSDEFISGCGGEPLYFICSEVASLTDSFNFSRNSDEIKLRNVTTSILSNLYGLYETDEEEMNKVISLGDDILPFFLKTEYIETNETLAKACLKYLLDTYDDSAEDHPELDEFFERQSIKEPFIYTTVSAHPNSMALWDRVYDALDTFTKDDIDMIRRTNPTDEFMSSVDAEWVENTN